MTARFSRITHPCKTAGARLVLATALGLAMAPAAALSGETAPGRIELLNGEVLVGTVVDVQDGVVVFHSETFGDLRMPASSLREVPADPVPDVNGVTGGVALAAAAAAATAPQPAPEPSASGGKEPVRWSRQVEVGFAYEARGNELSSRSTYLRAEIGRSKGPNSISVSGAYRFGEQNDEVNSDRLEAGCRIRQEFTRRILFRNDFTYGFDRLRELSNQFCDSAGINVLVFDNPRFRYSIGPGLVVDYAEPELGQNGYKILGDVSHDLMWQISERLALTHNGAILYTPHNWKDYRLRMQSALTGNLGGGTTMSVRYEYEFENIRPVANGRIDQRVYTTIGYQF